LPRKRAEAEDSVPFGVITERGFRNLSMEMEDL
jgi:hypothetical protein